MTNPNGNNNKNSKFYTIGITGASGLVGKAFQNELSKTATLQGKPIRIVTLSRGETAQKVVSFDDDDECTDVGKTVLKVTWNPKGSSPDQVIDPALLERLDALVHLAVSFFLSVAKPVTTCLSV
jgi:hypothetical protein